MIYVLHVFLAVYALWGVFVLVMGLQRAREAGTLTRVSLILGTPFVVVGYLLDVAVNVTVCTVVFLDPPREATVTARLKRYLANGSRWRRYIAEWIALHLLDSFDPSGKHI